MPDDEHSEKMTTINFLFKDVLGVDNKRNDNVE